MKLLNWPKVHLVINFLLPAEDFTAFKVFRTYSHMKCLSSSKFWSAKDLHFFIGHILLRSNSKPRMLQLIKQLHDIVKKQNLELAPEKCFSCFMLLIANYLDHEIGFNTFKPIQSKKSAIHKFFSPTTKVELMRFIGSMKFHFSFFSQTAY